MIKMPHNSRVLQYYQHIVSGLQQCITPIVAGTAALFATGNVEWWVAGLPFIITFILGRLASEISYQTSIKVVEEHSKK